jgi:Fe-S-cluster containining protein
VAQWKQSLVRKVLRIQRTVSCTGCGLCCTERFNTVRILPLEGSVIAEHLREKPEREQAHWRERLRAAVARYRLTARRGAVGYTCPFLEKDLTCALPFDVKPTACLSFNPVNRDRCEQSDPDYFSVFDRIERRNAAEFTSRDRAAIPVMVLRILDGAPKARRQRGPEPRLGARPDRK